MNRQLSIVMYHYVRDLHRSRYPRIKARELRDFRGQLRYIQRHHTVVRMADVIHSVRTGESLPPNAVLLTFDDGYIDHYATVFPLLFDAGLEGSFFPPVGPVCRDELLDVNRVHFVLASSDPSEVAGLIDQSVIEHRETLLLESPEEYRRKWCAASRFDTAEVIYIKRMLQVVLPESLRNQIARELFTKFVSVEEAAFARELYATEEQFRLMQACGMYVGSHGDSHYWLNAVPADVQRREIESSLKFLERVGSPVNDYWVMCYPYGAWNDSLIQLLGEYQCALGLTTEVAEADLDVHHPLRLPRWDTNDVPTNNANPDSPWRTKNKMVSVG